MPRGEIFDGEPLNTLTISGSKMQLHTGFSGRDFSLRI